MRRSAPVVWRAMRLLDRYVLRELLVPLAYCLGGFLLFWISFDLFGKLDEFQASKVAAANIVQYYIARMPELLVLVLPIALLLALLYALTNHARYQELTAMRAAGVSLWRICLPYLLVGFVLTFVVFYLNEQLAPAGSDKAEVIKSGPPSGTASPGEGDWKRNVNFQNSRDGRLWRIGAFNLLSGEMQNPHVDWKMPDGSRRQILGESATFTNNAWVFHEVKELRYPRGQEANPDLIERTKTNELVLRELTETPDVIRSEIRISSFSSIRASRGAQISISEIRNYLELHPQLDPKQSSMLLTQLHGRMAAPWTCMVVVLIAIPFGSASGRRNLFVGVASSIFICFSYFILMRFGLALGTGGYMAPWLAAWMPNLVFGSLGMVLTFFTR